MEAEGVSAEARGSETPSPPPRAEEKNGRSCCLSQRDRQDALIPHPVRCGGTSGTRRGREAKGVSGETTGATVMGFIYPIYGIYGIEGSRRDLGDEAGEGGEGGARQGVARVAVVGPRRVARLHPEPAVQYIYM